MRILILFKSLRDKIIKKCEYVINGIKGLFGVSKQKQVPPVSPPPIGNRPGGNETVKPQPTKPKKPEQKKPSWSPSAPESIQVSYYPKARLFSNPHKKIETIQKKCLEVLLIKIGVFETTDSNFSIYYPSRLLSYLDQEDAYFAFKRFLKDINLNPKKIIENENDRAYLRNVMVKLFDADNARWGTKLSDDPLYVFLSNSNDLYKFNNLIKLLDECCFLSRKIQKLSNKILFNEFFIFKDSVNKEFEDWNFISWKDLQGWGNTLRDYDQVFKEFQNILEDINNLLNLAEDTELLPEEISAISSLNLEVEKLKTQLYEGSIPIIDGLDELEDLKVYIREIIERHKRKQHKKEKSYDIPKSDEITKTQRALRIMGLTEKDLKNFTEEQLKKIYRKLAKINHPDAGGTNENFQLLSDAYDYLRDLIRYKDS